MRVKSRNATAFGTYEKCTVVVFLAMAIGYFNHFFI